MLLFLFLFLFLSSLFLSSFFSLIYLIPSPLPSSVPSSLPSFLSSFFLSSFPTPSLLSFLLAFETRSQYVAQVGLEPMTLLLSLPSAGLNQGLCCHAPQESSSFHPSGHMAPSPSRLPSCCLCLPCWVWMVWGKCSSLSCLQQPQHCGGQ